MVLTPSRMIELGTRAFDFKLLDVVSDRELTFEDIKGEKGTVVMFICNHCPYVIHVRDEILEMAREYQSRGVAFVAISSNDIVHYPDDGPAQMAKISRELSFPFPYLYDETQVVAKIYKASCTPDFFLFDADELCVYRGRMDRSSPGNKEPVDGSDLRRAMEHLLAGKEIPSEQYPSMGCNIKWIVQEYE